MDVLSPELEYLNVLRVGVILEGEPDQARLIGRLPDGSCKGRRGKGFMGAACKKGHKQGRCQSHNR